jgi:sporulation protein YlmC with PRC-barrel domain
MKLDKPKELVGKEVYDTNGNVIGTIDKMWNSWNEEYPGYFLGLKTNENTRDTFFRGTYKLIPIYSDFIREVSERITLNKTMDDLCRSWNKTIQCGPTTCPLEQLFEMPVFDKYQSRVGTFCSYVESDGTVRNFGIWLDPYLCQLWNVPYNTTVPIEPNSIYHVKDTINLDKTLDELKNYWHEKHHLF